MAGRHLTIGTLGTAVRGLPQIERAVFLAMLDERASYPAIAARLGIGVEDVEQAFASALVRLADALDVPPPAPAVQRWLRRVAAAVRLARRRVRR